MTAIKRKQKTDGKKDTRTFLLLDYDLEKERELFPARLCIGILNVDRKLLHHFFTAASKLFSS